MASSMMRTGRVEVEASVAWGEHGAAVSAGRSMQAVIP